jgi:hypothetical protein
VKTLGGRALFLSVALVVARSGSAGAAEIAPGISLSGDLRVRSESAFRNAAFSPPDDLRHAVLRLRVALGVDVDEHWDLNLQLTTGGQPTGENMALGTLDVDGTEVFIDRAFARLHAGEGRTFELLAGRTPNPYAYSMIVWDSDFDPDGLAEKFVFEGISSDFFLNLGQHVLAAKSDTDPSYGPAFFAIQPGVRLKSGEGTFAIAAAYYWFAEADDPAFGDVPVGSDYAIADLYATWTAETAGGTPWGVWADGLFNTEAPDHRTAWGIGLDLGSAKEKGSTRLSFSYMSIDRNALWINLGDASFSSGLTDQDMQGFVLVAAVGVGTNASLSASWYYKDSRDTAARENQLLIDLLLEF